MEKAPMSAELGAPRPGAETWVMAACGTSFIVLLGICISCCKNKPPITGRPAPPTPEATPRYESNLYPATEQTSQSPGNESDEDFEEIPVVRIENVPDGSPQAPSNRQPPTPSDRAAGANGKNTYINISEDQTSAPDYMNVNDGPSKPPRMRKDHTYLEVFPADTEFNLKVSGGDQAAAGGSTARKSLNSFTATSLSLSDSHSYENITVEEAMADTDYVNVSAETEAPCDRLLLGD